jgi:hypothetical protein
MGKLLQNSAWLWIGPIGPWVTALALVAFGFNIRVIYEQWYSRKMRKKGRDDVREIRDLTQRLQNATERLNKAGKCRLRFKVSLAVVPPPTSPSCRSCCA